MTSPFSYNIVVFLLISQAFVTKKYVRLGLGKDIIWRGHSYNPARLVELLQYTKLDVCLIAMLD